RPPREHLAVVKPLDGVLMLETMHFADELRDPVEVPAPKTAIGEKELDMALELVKAMTAKWEPAKDHDEYRESLMKVIEQKIKSGAKKLPAAKAKAKAPPGKVIDLVALLQQSLGESAKGQKRKTTRQRVAQRKAA